MKTVVILGMHRSGTSMVTGVLSNLGVHIGEDLIGKYPSNPLGHFEDRDFVRLNDQLLKAAGGSWDNPPGQAAIIKQGERMKKEIQIVSNKLLKRELVGWKDPRTCLTIELFLAELLNPFFIIVTRNPQEVALSLQKRNNFTIEKGLRLRARYLNSISDFFKKHPTLCRLELDYRLVRQEREKSVRQIIDFLQIKPSTEQIKKAIALIIPE